MYCEPAYYDDVVVLVKYNEKYQYYVTYKELWILDLKKLKVAFETKGFKVEDFEDERTGFEVLTKEVYGAYKDRIAKYKVSYEELEEYYQLFELTKLPYEDIREVLPIFYINFDKDTFYSFYTEPGSYEYYIPNGWEGILTGDVENIIPNNMMY